MKNQYQLSDEEDPQILNGLTRGTSDQKPLVAPPPTLPAPIGPAMASENLSIPPPQPVAPIAAQPKLPGMPPSVGPSDIENYLGQQKQQMNQFGPTQRLDLQNALNARHNSLGYKATEGLKGLADAVMMGVAGAGNPGWQKNFQDTEQQNAENQIGALKDERGMNREDVSTNMEMDKMNPSSSLSKQAQAEFGPILSKTLGIQPNKLMSISAMDMMNVADLGMKYADVAAQEQLKEMTIKLQTMLGLANVQNTAEERKTNAAKDIIGTGSPYNPFNPTTVEQAKRAREVLSGIAGTSPNSPTPAAGWKYLGKVQK